ncbi:general secretion pathway protein GspK [Halomonas urumqiensis]|uniref:T2SS protein K first SAM-like domain-containing protein n=1 Tax=Halomonas urumqiensis TaxID=1684789 RepID=A0A2N7UPA6_9GAMM|nr:type II secretion system protein GspK [Halomonas urumqiensis]PMR82256.1 hypothetical protein C1H70_03470 [Halomonas urumqiensis]PTB02966.1 hypothetical protein C6V82_00045 [Halomonas urumqiensis]GHE20917.1 hypothetical protein GCM10017767_14380 [Halomonas urumqiensis]
MSGVRHAHSLPGLPRERGAALLVVLWVVMLLGLLASAFAVDTAGQARDTRTALDAAMARARAEGAIWQGVLELLAGRQDVVIALDGQPFELDLDADDPDRDTGSLRLSVQALRGRIDINHADAAQLAALFGRYVEDDSRRDALVDAVQDFRDADDLRRLHGAEADDYRRAGLAHGPADRPFADVAELALVIGMDRRLYQRLLPLVTVHGERSVDRLVAPSEVLMALPGATSGQVEALLALRADSPPPAVSRFARGSGHVVEMLASARQPGGVSRGVRAVVRLHPGQREPYTILEWQHHSRDLFAATSMVAGEDDR